MGDTTFMDNFKKLFTKENYTLPIRWDGKDFYATLYGHLKKYREDVADLFAGDENLRNDIRSICQGIYLSVAYSFQGNPRAAYEKIDSVMEILDEKGALFDDARNILSEYKLYRVVDVHDTAKHDRKRIFHVPFSMRSKISTQRYSIPGFPCLYLGSSLRLCCEEKTGCNPSSGTVIAARFELETDTRPRLRFDSMSPTFDDNKFYIVNLATKPDKAIQAVEVAYDRQETVKQYLYMYPLIAACSYIRANKENSFAPEYIVPQLVTQWVQKHSGESIVGIQYYSCASLEASEKDYNFAFPTTGTPHRVRKTVSEYCARLAHRFKLTVPVTIQDFKSISACEKALNQDSALDYIENWETIDEEPDGEYEIPDGELTISPFAFAGCSNLTSINIPDSVTSIGDWAFQDCSSLKSINIPDSVTSIGDWAFQGCSKSLSIDLSPSNQCFKNENGILYSCDKGEKRKLLWFPSCNKQTLSTISDILKTVTAIGAGAFAGCSNLTSIDIPDSVTSIGDGTFSGCRNLTSITISNSVTSIGELTFSGCRNLTSITIPDSVSSIGDGAFWDCSKLESINIPDNVTSIGNFAFEGCSSLKSIKIPNSVTSIGHGAFQDCSSLKSIKIPNSVTSIGHGAFWDCSSLKSINIPDNVTSIGDGAFSGCSKLLSIDLSPSNQCFKNENGILYSCDKGEKRKLLWFPSCNEQTLSTISDIPKTVTAIGAGAFAGCSNLTSIDIPNSVTSIGELTFSGCRNLTSITILGSVTSIGDFAFEGCSSLKSITIPDSVTSIGHGAFQDCSSLKSITIPDSVSSIGTEAFRGCSKLKSIEIPDSVTSIGDGAFAGCSNLTSIDIPDSVTSIGDWVFEDCSSLKSIKIPNSVTLIGDGAFAGCSTSLSIKLSSSNQRFIHENGILYSCDHGERRKLLWFSSGNEQTSYTTPDTVTAIGAGTFSGCRNLKSIKIPDSVTSIDDFAFWGCSHLTINCEADSKPEGWAAYWQGDVPDDQIHWGVKKSTP